MGGCCGHGLCSAPDGGRTPGAGGALPRQTRLRIGGCWQGAILFCACCCRTKLTACAPSWKCTPRCAALRLLCPVMPHSPRSRQRRVMAAPLYLCRWKMPWRTTCRLRPPRRPTPRRRSRGPRSRPRMRTPRSQPAAVPHPAHAEPSAAAAAAGVAARRGGRQLCTLQAKAHTWRPAAV